MTLPAATRGLPAASAHTSGGAKRNVGGRANAKGPVPASGARKGWGSLAVAETNKAMEELRTMGFSEKAVRRALDLHHGDVNQALDFLLTQEPEVEEADSNVDASTTSEELPGEVDKHPASSSLSDVSTASECHTPPLQKVVPAQDSLGDPAISVDEESIASVDAKAEWEALPGNNTVAFGTTMFKEAADPSEITKPLTQSKVAEVASGASPQKRLLRSVWDWPEGLPDQLSVRTDEFVRVWIETRTDLGWVYAERSDDPSQAGWLPFEVLMEAPESFEFMRCSVPHIDETDRELNIFEGKIYAVAKNSCTSGWVFVGAPEKAENDSEGGWVPDYCFEGLSVA